MLDRGEGGVINVSSLAAFIALPGSVTYCATKAALTSFSRALDLETRPRGVRVQALCPGFMHTELHDGLDTARFDARRIPRFLWSDPADVVAASLAELARGRTLCIPGAQYRLIYLLARTGLLDALVPLAARRW
jgi:short-subunit dehydrogenase